ncbi:MAG: hypothetical protein EPN60_02010 [Nevskiaceae bacterium]|nr:MAG: hypothetical protein EPN60_02010 [Nevskiaceae bacterium]
MQWPRYRQWQRALALGLLCCSILAQARESPLYADCFQAAARHYGLAPELLIAIAAAESQFNASALNTANRDGSWDIGLMQINSRWMPLLESSGISATQLYDPCTSIWVGAWVLAGNVARYGYGWQAVGAYNAGTAPSSAAQQRRERYAQRIHRQLLRTADGLRRNAAAP